MPQEASHESHDIEMAGVHERPDGDVPNHVTTNGAADESMQLEDNEDSGTAEAETEVAQDLEQPLPSVEKDYDSNETNIAANEEPKPSVPQAAESIKQDKEIARLEAVVSDISPEAAQKFFRSHWRLFLFQGYDEDHISFALRALLKNSNKDILSRVMKDDTIFKEPITDVVLKRKLPKLPPAELIRYLPEHVLANVVCEKMKSSVTHMIIDKVFQNVTATQITNLTPTEVLESVLADGIRDASAKNLLAWMSDANRLGFKADDKLDDDDESVEPIPTHDYSSPYPQPGNIPHQLGLQPPPPGYPQQAYYPQPGPLYPNYPIQQPVQSAVRLPPQPSQPQPQPHFANPSQDPLLVAQERNLRDQIAENKKGHAESVQKHASRLARELQQAQASGPPWICTDCDQTMPTYTGYAHHRTKMPCQKEPPPGWLNWKKHWCENCCSGFTQSVGLGYHVKNRVCFKDPDTPKDSTPPPPSSLPPADAPNGYYPRPKASPGRPPLYTPTALGRPPKLPISTPSYPASKLEDVTNFRVSPSDLPPEKLAALDREIKEADEKYEKKLAEVPENLTEAERSSKLFSIKNQYTTQKSVIRKKYGVSLRLRDKDKKGRKALGLSDTPSKRTLDSSPLAQPSQSFPPILPPNRLPQDEHSAPSNKRQRTESARSSGPDDGLFTANEYDPASHTLNRKPVAPQSNATSEVEAGANERTRVWVSGAGGGAGPGPGAADDPMVVDDDTDSNASIPAEPVAKKVVGNGNGSAREMLINTVESTDEESGSEQLGGPVKEVIRSAMGDIIRT